MHLEAGRIQVFIDGELAPDEIGRVGAHLAECEVCRRAVDVARAEEERVRALLGALDAPAPAVSLARVAELAETGPGVRRWLRPAAGIILSLAVASAAYALPGSPLPRWVDRLMGEGDAGASPSIIERPAGGESTEGWAGIAVDPGPTLAIVLGLPDSGVRASGTLAIQLRDGPLVEIRSGPPGASFATEEGRVTITPVAAGGDFTIELPRSAAHVEVRLGERRLLLSERGSIDADAEPDSTGRYVISLAAGG